MKSSQHISSSDRFKLFHDLMAWKVKRILLISTPYEAWVMEEDCRLSEQIVNEYRGLSLSQPPRLTWASSAEEAIEKLREKEFDLVIAISSSFDFESFHLGSEIKKINPNMPVVLLTHQEVIPEVRSIAGHRATSIDHIFFWSGQADILLAIIKCIEDRHNTTNDILYADVRVILFVEDSPFYLSSILPTLYKELVIETQAVIDESLNQEHRLLIMRSRPKILIAHSFEDALELYEKYKANILGVISDVRYPRNDKVDERAGVDLLHLIKKDRFDVPLLLTSSEPHNAALAGEIPATFLDKNTSQLHDELKSFFFTYLGFDYFYFKTPTGEVLTSAVDLYDLELKISEIQLDSFLYHCRTNDFSRWLFCLAEFELAAEVRSLRETQFESS